MAKAASLDSGTIGNTGSVVWATQVQIPSVPVTPVLSSSPVNVDSLSNTKASIERKDRSSTESLSTVATLVLTFVPNLPNAINKIWKAPSFSICNAPTLPPEHTLYMNSIFAWASELRTSCLVCNIYGLEINGKDHHEVKGPKSTTDAHDFGECTEHLSHHEL